jgi:hypothetical protein
VLGFSHTSTGFGRPGVDPQRLAESFDWARRGALLAPTKVQVGYRVFWTCTRGGFNFGSLDLPARPGEYAILGRHDHCDGFLEADERVSLRHLLLTSYPLDGGGVAVRFLDLLTEMPMFLDDGIPRRSLVATGAVRMRLGSWVIGALPIVGGAVETNAALAEGAAPVQVHEASVPPKVTLSSRISTGVASLPAVTNSMILSYRQSARRAPPAGMASLTFARAEQSVTVEIFDEDLERGVLLGRADRCLDAGLRTVLTMGISRTHLLLLRDRGRTFAYDLATTNGTFERRHRVRRAELSDAGSYLWLGPGNGVALEYRRGPTLH